MAIEKRIGSDGRPRYYVRFDTKDPLSGARKRHRVHGSFTSKKEAEAAERKAMLSRDSGTLLEPDRMTVAQIFDAWLASKVGSVTPNTVADYQQVIRRHIIPAIGAVPIQRLSAATLQAQYTRWREAGLSAHLIRSAHQRLSQALDHAVRLKLLLHNPAKDVRPPSPPRPGFKVWDADEAHRFLAAADGDSYAPIWDLLLREGLRRGEALGLRWRDLHRERTNTGERVTAHIVQTVTVNKMGKHEAMIQPRVKTRAGARSVRLTDETIAALQALKDRRTWSGGEGDRPTPDGLILCTRHGTPIHPQNIDRRFQAIVNAASLPRIKLHELRHTAATLMLLEGVSAKVVSERLGHASIAITLDIYSHVLPSMQDDAAEAMSRVLARR